MVHYNTTANEIMEDSDGVFDVFVACVGTGGTITGTGKRLKELKPNVKIVAVEPESSAVLSGGQAGKHSIQGIGAGFVPDNYDSNTVDKIIQVKDKEAFDMMHSLAKKRGFLSEYLPVQQFQPLLNLPQTILIKGKDNCTAT